MPNKNTFTAKRIISKSTNLLEEHSLEMHRWLLMTVAIFATLLASVSFLLEDYLQGWVSLLSVPCVGIAYLMHKSGYTYLSKVFNGVQIITMVSAVSILSGAEALTFMYFFPIAISALIAFQGKEKYTGYFLIGIILIVLVILTTIQLPSNPKNLDPNHLAIDRFSNVIGVTICCIIILVFMIRAMDNIQRQLLENSHDINSKNQTLLEAIYSRDTLLSVISHDLRSPMASVITTVDVCTKGDIDDETKLELLHSLRNTATQTITMTDQLLEWSRSQTGSLPCNRETIPVQHFFNYVNDWGRLIAEPKNISIDVQFEYNVTDTVCCDKNMIETVLRNLISNAVKFSNPESKIVVRSILSENKRSFEVQDSGKGMTNDQMQKLKEGISFTTYGTNKEKGNGFGLQLVQEFLRRHHSHLEIHSEFGTGSLFSFKL